MGDRFTTLVLCAVTLVYAAWALRWSWRESAWLKRTGGYPDECPPCPECRAWWGHCEHRPFGKGGSPRALPKEPSDA